MAWHEKDENDENILTLDKPKIGKFNLKKEDFKNE